MTEMAWRVRSSLVLPRDLELDLVFTITALVFDGEAGPVRHVDGLSGNADTEILAALDAVRQAAQLIDEFLLFVLLGDVAFAHGKLILQSI